MDYNLLFGGAAGQGMETLTVQLEAVLKRVGFHVHTTHDYMSRIRGGHNFSQIRFGDLPLWAPSSDLTGVLALNPETVLIHQSRVCPGGFVLVDEGLGLTGPDLLALPLARMAKGLGEPQAIGNVALGVMLRLFGIGWEPLEAILNGLQGKKDLRSPNVEAVRAGFGLVEPRYDPPSPAGEALHMLNGSHAVALGALAADMRFYAAYPMTPSTAVMTYLAEHMVETGVVVEQAEDEIAAINMAIGASFAGVRAMTGTSGGGFCLMVEALGLSGILEVPLVVLNVQRPGPATGLPTRTEQADLRFAIHAGQGEFPRMVIALRDVADAYRQTQRAFDLADRYQIPVILLSDQYLADTRRTVPILPLRITRGPRFISDASGLEPFSYRRYEITEDGISPRIIPGQVPDQIQCVDSDEHDEWGHIVESSVQRVAMADKRSRKLAGIRGELEEPLFLGDPEAETLLLAWGSLAGPMREAVSLLVDQGLPVGALIFGDLWPLPTGELEKRLPRALHRIHVEQNGTGQLASLIREVTGVSMTGSVLKYDGRQLTPVEIVAGVRKAVTSHA